jgi:hypothetical protein
MMIHTKKSLDMITYGFIPRYEHHFKLRVDGGGDMRGFVKCFDPTAGRWLDLTCCLVFPKIMQIERACEDGTVIFRDGSVILADVILHCTG